MESLENNGPSNPVVGLGFSLMKEKKFEKEKEVPLMTTARSAKPS